MRLPRRLQGQKVKSQGAAGAYCGGDLAAQLVNIWNSLPDYVVDTDNLDTDNLEYNQEILFNYKSELSGTGNRSQFCI